MIASAMILTAPVILTGLKKSKPIRQGGVVIRRGQIIDIGSSAALFKKYPFHAVNRFADAVLLPGLVNAHSHLELPPLLDRIRARTLPDWVFNLMQAKRKLTSRDYVRQAERNIQTLIKTGTTTVGEICTHNASPGPLIESGLRGVIFLEIISMNPSAGLATIPLVEFGRSSRIKFGISPHAPHTVSEKVIKLLKKRYARLRFCMHVAESRDEINLLRRKKSGFQKLYSMAGWNLDWAPNADSPFLYLQKLGVLGPRFTAVHAVHTTLQDIRVIKKTETTIVHCPRSNRQTNAGKMPLKVFLDADVSVGLGTDSLASASTLNMWDEMRFAYHLHRHTGVTAADIMSLATHGGATVLGLGGITGTLEPGKRADIIAVPIPKRDTGNIYSDLIRETKSSIMTMVNGDVLHSLRNVLPAD